MEKTGNKKYEVFESLVVFGVMTGLLLPVRMIFYTFVSTNWFGSFGVISLISIAMIILVKKNKLGRFGIMFENQMRKIQRGKRGYLVYGQTIFFLVIIGGNIFAIEMGNGAYLDIKTEMYEKVEGIDDPNKILEQSKDMDAKDWVLGFLGFILAIFFLFPQASAAMSILNDTFGGWPLHFYTVAFVESMEVFGILLFYRFNIKK